MMSRPLFGIVLILIPVISFVLPTDTSRVIALNASSSNNAEREKDQRAPLMPEIYSDYFVRNDVLPFKEKNFRTGVLQDSTEFEKIFGVARVMSSTQRFLPDDYFDTHEIIFYAEWGNVPWDYAVRSIQRDGETLTVKVTQTGEVSASATFISPLILGFSRVELTNIKTLKLDVIPADAPLDTVGTIISIDLQRCHSTTLTE